MEYYYNIDIARKQFENPLDLEGDYFTGAQKTLKDLGFQAVYTFDKMKPIVNPL